VWKKDDTLVYVRRNANGDPIKIQRPDQVIWYEQLVPVASFNASVFEIPATCRH